MGSAAFSDTELLKGLVLRDERILQEYYNLYFKGIRRFVLSNKGNNDDARDLFHDALLVLFQKARSNEFILTCSPGTYLYSVSKFLWLKELGKRKRLVGPVDYEAYMDTDSDISLIHEKNERLLFFRKCFEKLPDDCRKVLTLFMKGFSIPEITDIMGYGSEQYTRNRKYRCKSALIASIKAEYDYKNECDGEYGDH